MTATTPTRAPAGVRRTLTLITHLAARDVAQANRFSVIGAGWPLLRQLAQLAVLAIAFSAVLDLGIPDYPVFVFAEGEQEVRIETEPGDYVFVPPYVPHREENPGEQEAVVVIARSSQEGVVVNLPSLWAPVERDAAESGNECA